MRAGTLSILLAAACTGTRGPEPVRAPASHETPDGAASPGTEGVVYLAGNEPGLVLSLKEDAGGVHRLVGPLADELRRLTGARVSVVGAADSTTYPPVIQVTEYVVREIDGRRPLVGELRGGPESLWLLTPDSLALDEPTGRLEAFAGAKVWVVVDTASRPALVQSFGLLRQPAP